MDERQRCRFFRRLWCIFAAAVFFLASCAPSNEKLLGYRDGRIEAEITGVVNSVEISARLTLLEASDGSVREFELTVLSPKTLEGTVFRRASDGSLTASVGDVTVEIDASTSSGAVLIADAFSAEGEPTGISAVRGGDVGLPQHEELTRIDFPRLTVFLDPKTDTPVKLVSPELELLVTSFEKSVR